MPRTRVAVVAFDGIRPFHLSVPCAVFGEAAGDEAPPFELRVCAAEPGGLRTQAGFGIVAQHGLRTLAWADIVVVPSWRDPREPPPEPLLAALRRAHARGALVVGLCLGAFVLAEAGLLDGRRATTHWRWAARASPNAIRGYGSIPACCTWTKATCSPRPAPPPASTAACMCYATASARRRQTA